MENTEIFKNLISKVIDEKWCTKFYCTTCGAMPFRKALQKISRLELIAGLRELDEYLVTYDRGMFLYIIDELSNLPLGTDLLPELLGTPAGNQLQKIINYETARIKKSNDLEKFNSIESIADRKIDRKNRRLLATEPHRTKKYSNTEIIKSLINKLDSTSDSQLLEDIDTHVPDKLKISFGGIYYKRISTYCRNNELTINELTLLKKFALLTGGFWLKILNSYNKTNITIS